MQQLLTYADVKAHMGHDLFVSHEGGRQDPASVSIECADCEDSPVLATFERPETAAGFKVRKTRPVEMYYGNPSPQTWDTFDVAVPVDTPADRIAAAAGEAARRDLERLGVEAAFYGVYFIPDLTELKDEEDDDAG